MSERLVSFVFLALLILVPVGVVAGIVLAVVRRLRSSHALGRAAKERGWETLGRDTAATEPLRRLLEPTLFAMQGNATHRLADVVRGRLDDQELYLARYTFSTPSPSGEMGRRGTYRMAVLTRPGPGPVFWLHAPRPGLAGRVVEGLAGGLGGRHLSRGTGDWAWAMVSSHEAAGTVDGASVACLRRAVETGGFLFLFEGLYVLLTAGEPDSAWAGGAPDRLRALLDVHAA